MIREYINKAMERAHYEILDDDGSYYGEIVECPGVLANAITLEACRRDLESTLEEWIILRIHRNLTIPEIDGLTVKVTNAVA